MEVMGWRALAAAATGTRYVLCSLIPIDTGARNPPTGSIPCCRTHQSNMIQLTNIVLLHILTKHVLHIDDIIFKVDDTKWQTYVKLTCMMNCIMGIRTWWPKLKTKPLFLTIAGQLPGCLAWRRSDTRSQSSQTDTAIDMCITEPCMRSSTASVISSTYPLSSSQILVSP